MTSIRLARFSQWMASATFCLACLMLLLNVVCWFYPVLNSPQTVYDIGFGLTDELIPALRVDVAAFPWWQRIGGVFLSSIPLLALARGLFHLRWMFQSYGRREYLSMAAAVHLGQVGRAVALWVVLSILCEPVLSVWLTIREPAGRHMITLSFGWSYAIALFLVACIVVISHILRQASELDAEHQQFI